MAFRERYGDKLINPVVVDQGPDVTKEELWHYLVNNRLVPAFQGYQSIDSATLHTPEVPWYAYEGGEFCARFLRSTNSEVISPKRFLAAARIGRYDDETTMLGELSLRTGELAARMVGAAQAHGAPELTLSINAPDDMLSHVHCPRRIHRMAERNGIALRQIILEVLQKDSLSDTALTMLSHIGSVPDGPGIAIDDFPEKHALDNIAMLVAVKAPIHTIKIASKRLMSVTPDNARTTLDPILATAARLRPDTIVFEGRPGLHPHIQELLQERRDHFRLNHCLFEGRLITRTTNAPLAKGEQERLYEVFAHV